MKCGLMYRAWWVLECQISHCRVRMGCAGWSIRVAVENEWLGGVFKKKRITLYSGLLKQRYFLYWIRCDKRKENMSNQV